MRHVLLLCFFTQMAPVSVWSHALARRPSEQHTLLRPPTASRYDQGLTQRVAVPGGPSTGFEGDTGANHAGWLGCLEQGINTYRAGKVLARSVARRLRTTSFDVHEL